MLDIFFSKSVWNNRGVGNMRISITYHLLNYKRPLSIGAVESDKIPKIAFRQSISSEDLKHTKTENRMIGTHYSSSAFMHTRLSHTYTHTSMRKHTKESYSEQV